MAGPTLAVSTAPPPEQRIVLHHIAWDTYERMLNDLGNNRSVRLAYYRGSLEIMTPLEEHERAKSLIRRFIEILIAELGLNRKSMASTRLTRPDLQASGEPEECYYIQNEPLVRGKTVDLANDPPPDLVLEVDITHTDLDKLKLYADLGIPEFWRYNGKIWRIYQLEQGSYTEVEASPTFPWVRKQLLYDFLSACNVEGETKAERSLQLWVRSQAQQLQDKQTNKPD
jgi:Uma2 family endonuclease